MSYDAKQQIKQENDPNTIRQIALRNRVPMKTAYEVKPIHQEGGGIGAKSIGVNWKKARMDSIIAGNGRVDYFKGPYYWP